VRAAIGTSQDSPFQDIPLTVRVAEVTAMFGVYIKSCHDAIALEVSSCSSRRSVVLSCK
jgi:hypothetical protein